MKEKYGSRTTVRGVPPAVSRGLRDRARREAKSLNKAAIEAWERELGLADAMVLHSDLDDLAGTWVPDPDFDLALQATDREHENLWK